MIDPDELEEIFTKEMLQALPSDPMGYRFQVALLAVYDKGYNDGYIRKQEQG
jgi:hypothetical protein